MGNGANKIYFVYHILNVIFNSLEEKVWLDKYLTIFYLGEVEGSFDDLQKKEIGNNWLIYLHTFCTAYIICTHHKYYLWCVIQRNEATAYLTT